ncbi:hypothetical protein ACFL27_25985 [candidate division CSSED10-310 bacterium]|uniref:EfeO-type cupredoxin-like domain-containing protein n=1 Tax=candidate division CSSED10-310 bacterium TaxID=2855610 RepID=A0ABV6Z5M2_UNCC1
MRNNTFCRSTFFVLIAWCVSGFFAISLICPQAALAEKITFGEQAVKEGFNLERADADHVQFTFSINQANLADVNINGEAMTHIAIPGSYMPRDFGMPDLPAPGTYIAIPQGARASVEIVQKKDIHARPKNSAG